MDVRPDRFFLGLMVYIRELQKVTTLASSKAQKNHFQRKLVDIHLKPALEE